MAERRHLDQSGVAGIRLRLSPLNITITYSINEFADIFINTEVSVI